MIISKESLTAYNLQKDNDGNDAYRKANKLGDRRERLELQCIATTLYGCTGGHRTLSISQVEREGRIIQD